MDTIFRSAAAGLILILGAFGYAGPAHSQFPNGPITIVVPYAPGGGDLLARVLQEPLSKRLGVPIVVDAKGGGAGIVGSQIVANGPPDGQRILFHSSAATINQAMHEKPPLDIRTELAPVTRALAGTFALYVLPSLKVNTLRELIDYAKANPGKLDYGSSGIGGSMHLITELIQSSAGIKMTHVPYKGGAPALVAALQGEVQVLVFDAGLARAAAEAGKIKMLALASPQRSPFYPGVPLVSDTLPGAASGYWWGFFAHKATPRAIIDRLNRDIVATMRQPDITEAFHKRGYDILTDTPEEFGKVVAAEVAQWTDVVRKAGVPLQ